MSNPSQNTTPVEGKSAIKPWPLNGYAPGNYMNTCCKCKKQMTGVDKLCFICLECALIANHEYIDKLKQEIISEQHTYSALKGENERQAQRIKELEKEVSRYKRLLELAKMFKTKAEESARSNYMAAQTLDSELDMNAILTEENEKLQSLLADKDKEIERIKNLFYTEYISTVEDMFLVHHCSPETAKAKANEAWDNFKSANNL